MNYWRNQTINTPILGGNAWRPRYPGVAELHGVWCPNVGLNVDCTANPYLIYNSPNLNVNSNHWLTRNLNLGSAAHFVAWIYVSKLPHCLLQSTLKLEIYFYRRQENILCCQTTSSLFQNYRSGDGG